MFIIYTILIVCASFFVYLFRVIEKGDEAVINMNMVMFIVVFCTLSLFFLIIYGAVMFL